MCLCYYILNIDYQLKCKYMEAGVGGAIFDLGGNEMLSFTRKVWG